MLGQHLRRSFLHELRVRQLLLDLRDFGFRLFQFLLKARFLGFKIKQALELSNWNKTQAPEMLAVSYKTLLTKVKEYELE